ncbi:MAG: hypothetical protein RIQ89_33 [Bacteroidota bacterium]|jgi:hypothetical protein
MFLKNQINRILKLTFLILQSPSFTVAGEAILINPMKVSINGNLGAVVALSKHNKDPLYVPSTLSQYYGIMVNASINKTNLAAGIQSFAFPVCTGMNDEVIKIKKTQCFNNKYTAYLRIPIEVGFDFTIGVKQSFTITPYMSHSLLLSQNNYSYISSNSFGTSYTATDTIITASSQGIKRTKNKLYCLGIGIKSKYRYKKLNVNVNIEYFQSFNPWIDHLASYNRSSNVYGLYATKNLISSVEKNIIVGFSIGRFIFN